jgi:catechol 2,3-dioxygenase-like lactoylglutathione lyase family enzyme
MKTSIRDRDHARLLSLHNPDSLAATDLNMNTILRELRNLRFSLVLIAMMTILPSLASAAEAAAASDSSLELKPGDVQLQVFSRVHFNTNVSDFDTSRAFYGMLGFETFSGFPDTNTQAMARAIGIETPTDYDGTKGEEAGGYLLHGELIGVAGFTGGLIDLIEFTIPHNEAPPYAQLNHLGMARAAMHTTNLDADYNYMIAQGVNFLSSPVQRSDGSRFAIFTDPDGTFYELEEIDGEAAETETTHIVSLGHVSINVSDLARSVAWYQMLGYEVIEELPATDSTEVAAAMGFPEGFQIEGAVLQHASDESTLELVQWIQPFNPERAYPIPINHIGINRMAFATDDIEADVAMLKAHGVEFISEITPCCSGPDSWGSIVAFYDPDGTIVELVEQPGFNQFMRFMIWLRNLFL